MKKDTDVDKEKDDRGKEKLYYIETDKSRGCREREGNKEVCKNKCTQTSPLSLQWRSVEIWRSLQWNLWRFFSDSVVREKRKP